MTKGCTCEGATSLPTSYREESAEADHQLYMIRGTLFALHDHLTDREDTNSSAPENAALWALVETAREKVDLCEKQMARMWDARHAEAAQNHR
ncbi:MAG TPA: hypothetical protein DIT67_06675 [Octadecabacter sp.]|nr:hypothetical protein [Octadecabacter sp.]